MSEFKQHILKAVDAIPYGFVASYGQIALYVGFPRGARQVGWILNATEREPHIKIPWWRVINNAGIISIKGTIHNDATVQRKFLQSEGILVDDEFNIDIEHYRWRPTKKELKKLKLSEEYIDDLIQKYRI